MLRDPDNRVSSAHPPGTGDEDRSHPRYFVFGDFHFDRLERQLYRGTEPIHLSPKVFHLLEIFLDSPRKLHTRETLFDRIWADRYVEDSNLTQTVFLLRQVLGDDSDSEHFIVTEPGVGYRFVHEVSRVDSDPATTNAGRTGAATRSGKRWLVASATATLIALLIVSLTLFTRSATPPSLSEIESLAVLPFVDLATNRPTPVGLGFSDAITTELTRSTDMAVRPLSTVVDYARASETSAEAGRKLQVDAILTGTLLGQGDETRISVQIVIPETERTLWADSFQLPGDEPFDLQRAIARRIVESAFPEGAARTTHRASTSTLGTDDFTAYEALMEGRYHLSSRSSEGMMLAREAFQRALQRDSRYPEAWSDLSATELLLGFYSIGDLPARERCRRARTAARRALDLRPDLAGAHTTLGMIELHCALDFEASEAHFRKGVSLAPDDPRAHHWYAWLAWSVGDRELAATLIENAHHLNPLSLIVRSAEARMVLYRGDLEEAIRLYDSILAVDGRFGRAHFNRGLALEQAGRLDEAEEAMRRAAELFGPTDEIRAGLARLALARGETTLPAAVEGIESPMQRAYVVAAGGSAEEAIDLILQAIDRREAWLWEVRADPRLEAVRGHPDFGRVEEAVGIPLRLSGP